MPGDGLFGGSGLWGNRWRLRVAATAIYGPTGIVGYFDIVGGEMRFRFLETVAAGGGRVRYGGLGITSVTDAGAAGPQVRYDPTNNYIYPAYWTATQYIQSTAAQNALRVDNTILSVATGVVAINLDAIITPAQLSFGGNGWLLAKGVSGDDRSEFINTDWAAAEAPGVKWLTSDVVAPARLAARGGVWRKSTNSVTPSWWKGLAAVYSAQDAYRIYARYAMQQIVNCRFAVGVCDDVPAAAPNSLPYTNEGIQCVQDDAVGPNHLLRQVTGGAVVDDDSTIAVVAGEYHAIDILVAATRIPTLYIDGTLRATGAAADSPPAATLLRKAIYADNIGAAVLAQLDIDVYDIVESRNTAVTP